MDIHGHCDERFGAVGDLFERNFTEHGDVGASFAATVDGEHVVDVCGGHKDAAKTAGRSMASRARKPPKSVIS